MSNPTLEVLRDSGTQAVRARSGPRTVPRGKPRKLYRQLFVQGAANDADSDGPTQSPMISRRPSVFTGTAIMAAAETMRPPSRTFR